MRALAVTILALALSGCARDPFEGKIQIRYMAWGNPEQQALEQQFCADFNSKNPDIHVTFFRVPGSAYKNKMIVMLASRTAPDVIRVDHYDFPSLVRKNYFLDMDPLAARDKGFRRQDYFPFTLREGTYQGHLYGMNVMGGATILYFNKDLFKKAGLPDPNELAAAGKWTFEQFRKTAVALTKMQSDRPVQFGFELPDTTLRPAFLWGFGGDLLSPDHKQSMLNDPRSIRGLQWMADLRFKDHCIPTVAQAANSAFNFESGKLAMTLNWMGMGPRYRKAIKNFEWDIAPIPVGPVANVTVVKGNQLCINASTEHPDAAWRFVRYMTGYEVELELYGRRRRNFPSRIDVATSKEFLDNSEPPAHTGVFLQEYRKGRELPIDYRWSEWTTAMNTALDDLWSGRERNAAVVARRAAAAVNEVLEDEEGF